MPDPRTRVIHHAGNDDAELIDRMDGVTVQVSIAGRQPPLRHQVLGICLVNLLGRIFPRVEVVAEKGARANELLPPGPEHLVDRLEEARANGIGPLPGRTSEVHVRVGGPGPADLFADGDGWQSYIGTRPSRLEPTNSALPVGPLLAAARAGGRIFAIALRDQLAPPPPPLQGAYSSALSYRSSAEPFEEPAAEPEAIVGAVLVGAGSVGGAVAYLLGRCQAVRGRVDVVDPQNLEEPNFVRALLASRADSAAGLAKVDAVAAALAHLPDLEVAGHAVTMAEYIADRPREAALPLVLSPVDSINSRRQIQDSGPLELINAACDGTIASVSGHVTDDGPCVYCLHLPDVLDSDTITERLIADRLRLPRMTVRQWLASGSPLGEDGVRQIEGSARLQPGALRHAVGQTVDELYRSQFLYGELAVAPDTGARVAVASPFLTALTGFVLGAELLKASAGPSFAGYRLGPRGQVGIRYQESLLHGPAWSVVDRPARWPGPECLCRSTRRLRLMRQRYGLTQRVPIPAATH